jgi:hypothetical protein
MLMEVAMLLKITTTGTSTYTRAQDPYTFLAPQWKEPPADVIADALAAAGPAASQVAEEAIAAARVVLNLLPEFTDPTVAVEDNEITLEWYKDRQHVATIAVDGRSISWAVMAGSGNPLKGKEPFDTEIPADALTAITAAVG